MKEVVVVEVQLVDERERGVGAAQFGDGDGVVECDDGCRGDREEVVVEGDDLRPVGVLEFWRVGVHGVDRGLELVGARFVLA